MRVSFFNELHQSCWRFLMCIWFVIGYGALHAQGGTTSSIFGRVTDRGGKPMEGAIVVAKHEPSGTEYTTRSQAKGYYYLLHLRVGGPYTISFTAQGDTKTIEGVSLSLGEEQNIPLSFQPSPAQAEVLEEVVLHSMTGTKRAGASTTLSNRTLTDIATSSRNFNDLLKLDPRANGLSFGGRNSLYNNITLDGANFNNAYGLTNSIGGYANASPVSLDAIDQIKINLAPYDVRQGLSTGANVQIVTRAGDNEFRGSVYSFYQTSGLIGARVGNNHSPVSEFNQLQLGVRLGGAIIKNKLFFFVSYEQENRTFPPSPSFVASGEGVVGGNVSAAHRDTLQRLAQFLKSTYGYDPGPFEKYTLQRESKKLNVRLDYTISKAHSLNVKFNYLSSYEDHTSGWGIYWNSDPSSTGLPFLATGYRVKSDVYAISAELNSRFSPRVNHHFFASYTLLPEYSEAAYKPGQTPFPRVDIGYYSSYTAFGHNQYAYNSTVNTNIFHLQDDISFALGAHLLTAGVAAELNSFSNTYATSYLGHYQFSTLDKFYQSAQGTNGTIEVYNITYALGKDKTKFPRVTMPSNIYSVYVQDEWEGFKHVKITAGLRLDMYHFPERALENPVVSTLTFADGKKYNTGQFPNFLSMLSPRLGVNYDVLGNGRLQVRAGVGIFTGRVPFVWFLNQASNNGMLYGYLNKRDKDVQHMAFSSDRTAHLPAGREDTATHYTLVLTDPNFKLPQVLRANLAVDYLLGKGWMASVEAMYTKDIYAMDVSNIALPSYTGGLNSIDTRNVWYTPNATNTGYTSNKNTTLFTQGTTTSPTISEAILTKNTTLGYSFVFTAQVRKQFRNGLSASLAYTYTEAKAVNDGGSATNKDLWTSRPISIHPNGATLANAAYLQPHRVNAFVSYEFSYARRLKTMVSVFYSASSAYNFSYTYAGDANGDGQNNDLIYVPKDESEIRLVDIEKDGRVVYTAADQWKDLNHYINQDDYLKTRRGQYAERNATFAPWMHQMDVRLLQEIKFNLKGKNAHRIQITLDIFNVLNLLNSNWGVVPQTNRSGLIRFEVNKNTGQAEYTFPYLNEGKKQVLNTTFSDNTSIGSRWAMQLGVRYIFN